MFSLIYQFEILKNDYNINTYNSFLYLNITETTIESITSTVCIL